MTTSTVWRAVAAGGVVIVAMLLILAVYAHVRWQGEQYFGEIQGLIEQGIVISDPQEGTRTVLIPEHAEVRRGNKIFEGGLQVGDSVVVVGEELADGSVEARLIRVVDYAKRESRPESDRP
jgi:hypothetical protein